MSSNTPMQRKISSIVCETLTLENVHPDQDLIEDGVLDSLALVQLMVALEEGFDITISAEELDIEDYRTVNKMASMASRLLKKSSLSQYG